MEARVRQMIAEVMRREGGYANHPADKGGPTQFGVTQGALSDYLGRRVSVEEVRGITAEMAVEIYYTRYFLLPRVDALPVAIQALMLDMCVNHGAKNAMRILQRVINQSEMAQVDEDGVCGPQTQGAAAVVERRMGRYFLNALVDERLNFYRNIVGNAPSQLVFLNGWERRAESFRVAV